MPRTLLERLVCLPLVSLLAGCPTEAPVPPEPTPAPVSSEYVLEDSLRDGSTIRLAFSSGAADEAGLDPEEITLTVSSLGERAPGLVSIEDTFGSIVTVGPPGVDLGPGFALQLDLPPAVDDDEGLLLLAFEWTSDEDGEAWRELTSRRGEGPAGQAALDVLMPQSGDYAFFGERLSEEGERDAAVRWGLLPRTEFLQAPSATGPATFRLFGIPASWEDQPELAALSVRRIDGSGGTLEAIIDVPFTTGGPFRDAQIPQLTTPGLYEASLVFQVPLTSDSPPMTVHPRRFVVAGSLELNPESDLWQAALRHAPVLELAPGEQWLPVPLGSSYFAGPLELTTGNGALTFDGAAAPALVLEELRTRGYATAIMGGKRRPWAARLLEQGPGTLYVSAHADAGVDLTTEGARVLLTYWSFWLHDPKDVASCSTFDDVSHDRDRESVTVELFRTGDTWAPGSGGRVGFAGHLAGQRMWPVAPEDDACDPEDNAEAEWIGDVLLLDWDDVDRDGTHPIVYVARGSHAAYPRQGLWAIDAGWYAPALAELAGGGASLCPADAVGCTGTALAVAPLPRLETTTEPGMAGAEVWFSGGWVDGWWKQAINLGDGSFPPFLERFWQAPIWFDAGSIASAGLRTALGSPDVSGDDDDSTGDDDDSGDDDDAGDDDDSSQAPGVVPAGAFWMGCATIDNECQPQESPRHEVLLDAFSIDQTEVTVGDFEECVVAGGCAEPDAGGGCNWGMSGRDDHPINCVSWYHANDYCSWNGQRLPTEAEWEKAARGTDERVFPWGDSGPSCAIAQFNGCAGDTIEVGTRPLGMSPYGIHDMAGNIWEWVADWYDPTYYSVSPSEAPPGPANGSSRTLRGGHYDSYTGVLRTSYRLGDDPSASSWPHRGFRCATTLE